MKLQLTDIQKELSKRSLSYFIKCFWNYIDPAEYIHNWHIDAIAEHLEAVTSGQIKRLIINIPPRHQKSLTVAVFWPAWHWITKPSTQWLFSSYAHSLSIRDSAKCRSLIQSPLYQAFFGDIYQILPDQNTKLNFKNNKNGCRIATSVGGSNTGEGANILCYDDANNMSEIMSKCRRESVIEWHEQVMSTRLNNPKEDAKVVIGQRGHNYDISGYILEKEPGWEHLCLPARYESKHQFISRTSLNFVDKRNEGELLWPDRFSEKEISEIEQTLGSYGAAGQLQQRPAPAGGGMIKLEWFKRYKTLPPAFNMIIQSWDTAQKSGQLNDFSVCTTWGILRNICYLIDIWRDKKEYPELKRIFNNLFAQFKPNIVLVEDKGNGTSLIQELRSTVPIKPIEPVGDKIMRMSAESATIEAGFVYIPENQKWLNIFEQEISVFPNAANDDQVDSVSQFIAYFRTVVGSTQIAYKGISREVQYNKGAF